MCVEASAKFKFGILPIEKLQVGKMQIVYRHYINECVSLLILYHVDMCFASCRKTLMPNIKTTRGIWLNDISCIVFIVMIT